MLHNLEDVCRHLDASTDTNEDLSHSVYESTECGAWAKVIERPKVEKREETWSVHYANVDGWMAVSASRDGAAAEFSAMPKNVRDYFLIGAEHQEIRTNSLPELAAGRSGFDETAKLVGEYLVGVEHVFLVGSIVEGTDAEVSEQVVLPAEASAIDAAVQSVEEAVDDLWGETHGCEGCAKLQGLEWEPGATRIEEECPDCGGDGIAI